MDSSADIKIFESWYFTFFLRVIILAFSIYKDNAYLLSASGGRRRSYEIAQRLQERLS